MIHKSTIQTLKKEIKDRDKTIKLLEGILNNLIKHIPKEKPSDNLVKYEGNNSQQTNRRTNISLTAKDGDTLNKSADISSNLDAPCIVCGLREEVDSGMCEDCRNDAIKHLNAFQTEEQRKDKNCS